MVAADTEASFCRDRHTEVGDEVANSIVSGADVATRPHVRGGLPLSSRPVIVQRR
jgi:hypothetical protein